MSAEMIDKWVLVVLIVIVTSLFFLVWLPLDFCRYLKKKRKAREDLNRRPSVRLRTCRRAPLTHAQIDVDLSADVDLDNESSVNIPSVTKVVGFKSNSRKPIPERRIVEEDTSGANTKEIEHSSILPRNGTNGVPRYVHSQLELVNENGKYCGVQQQLQEARGRKKQPVVFNDTNVTENDCDSLSSSTHGDRLEKLFENEQSSLNTFETQHTVGKLIKNAENDMEENYDLKSVGINAADEQADNRPMDPKREKMVSPNMRPPKLFMLYGKPRNVVEPAEDETESVSSPPDSPNDGLTETNNDHRRSSSPFLTRAQSAKTKLKKKKKRKVLSQTQKSLSLHDIPSNDKNGDLVGIEMQSLDYIPYK